MFCPVFAEHSKNFILNSFANSSPSSLSTSLFSQSILFATKINVTCSSTSSFIWFNQFWTLSKDFLSVTEKIKIIAWTPL